MPIPQITFWCSKTYTGPWRSHTYTYSGPGVTTTDTYIDPAATYEITFSNTPASTYTYTISATTHIFSDTSPGYTYIDEATYPDPNFYPYGWDPCVDNTATVAWAIPVG